MAYVKGKCVYQGRTGQKLSCHKSKKEAEKRMRQLHKTHMPDASNRGVRARKKRG